MDTLDAAFGLHLATLVHDPVGRPVAGERGDDLVDLHELHCAWATKTKDKHLAIHSLVN